MKSESNFIILLLMFGFIYVWLVLRGAIQASQAALASLHLFGITLEFSCDVIKFHSQSHGNNEKAMKREIF